MAERIHCATGCQPRKVRPYSFASLPFDSFAIYSIYMYILLYFSQKVKKTDQSETEIQPEI